MKLHLPNGLRAALLAAFAYAATNSVSAATAVYDNLYTTESILGLNAAPDTLIGATPIEHTLAKAASSSWSWTLTGHNLTPHFIDPDDEESASVSLAHRGRLIITTTNRRKWELEAETENGFFVVVAPDGDFAVHVEGKDGKQKTSVVNNVSKWGWDVINELTITLVYNAEEQRLSVVSGSVQREEGGSITQIKPVADLNYAVPEDLFSARMGDDIMNLNLEALVFLAGNGSTLDSVLTMEGSETGWRIDSATSLNGLLKGDYMDETGAEATGLAMTGAHKVQFVGNNGLIYLEEGEKTYTNTTVCSANPSNGDTEMSVGFGAAEGATLTVERAALLDTVLGASATALRVVADGTVQLGLGGDTVNLESLSGKGTLEILSDADTTLNVAEGAISKSSSIVYKSAGGGAGNVTASLNIAQGGEDVSGIQVKDIDVQNGSLKLNAETPDGAGIAVTANVLKASVDVNLTGNVKANTIEAGNNVLLAGGVVNAATVQAGGNVVVHDSLTAGNVVAADTVEVDSSAAAGIKANSVDAAIVETNGVTITAATTRSDVEPLLKGGVVVDATGVKANEIGAGATISVSGDSVVDTSKLTNADISTSCAELAGVSTNKRVVIKADSLAASGELEAKTVKLVNGYVISAAALEADDVEAGDTEYTGNVVMSGVRSLSDTAASVDSITADSIDIAEGYVLSNAVVETQNGMSVGDGAVLKDVSVKGKFIVGDSEAVVNLENVTFGGSGTQFGGDQGRDYTVDKESNGVENVVLTGTLTGSDLSISNMALYAEDLQFAKGKKDVTYAILETDGKTITYEPDVTNYELYIQSYVRAELVLDGNTVKIVGEEDEAGIKNELTGTDNAAATMTALESPDQDMVDGSALSELNKYIGHVNRYSLEERKAVLEALSGASLTALADSQRRGVQDHQDNLRNRIIQMGGGTNAGLTTDWKYAGIQAWAQADGSFSTSDGSGDECGYDFDTWGATVGANMDLTANTVVGLAFSASYGEIKSDGADRASGNNDAQYISLYARHQKERWVQMLILTAGMNDMDLERRVLGYTAEGDTEGTTLSAYYELGYTIGLNYEFTHILQPMVSVSVTSAKVDGYTESGSLDNAALEYDGDSYVYGKVGIGARYQGVMYETVHERNAIVEARALVTQDFGDTTESAKVALGASGMYEVTGADTSGTGFELGVGFSIPVEQHTTLYADADMTMAPDYTGFRGNIGVRYDF